MIILDYLKAFITGGVFCIIGQILVDKTSLTPARILVSYVVAGVFLELLGIYGYILSFGGAGASVPLTGFGSVLCRGVIKAVNEQGFIGILTGGMTAAAAGISSALLFGFLVALIFKSKPTE